MSAEDMGDFKEFPTKESALDWLDNYLSLDERNNLIRALEQEPKTGHWIDGHCSECGCDVPAYIVDWKWQKDMDAKFCPNCGARMESIVKEV